MKETWRPIAGYVGYYEVSNFGKVRSLDRFVLRNGRKVHLKGKTLKPGKMKEGHLHVNLVKDGISKGRPVHSLVLETFVGPCPNGQECRHFPDRNPSNNCVTNLKWGTRKEQYRDRMVHGTGSNGSKNINAKLQEPDIPKIIKLRNTGSTYQTIANLFGVSTWTIWNVVNKVQWKHAHNETYETGKVVRIS